MNLVSFNNFSDHQSAFLPPAEKDDRTDDFSAILQSIFVALQSANPPLTNFSDGFKPEQLVSESGQNFAVNNVQFSPEESFFQNIVSLPNREKIVSFQIVPNAEEFSQISQIEPEAINPTTKTEPAISFSPTESLLSIPTNFQSVAKLPTMHDFLAEISGGKESAEISQNQSAVEVKDFEIVSMSEKKLSEAKSIEEIKTISLDLADGEIFALLDTFVEEPESGNSKSATHLDNYGRKVEINDAPENLMSKVLTTEKSEAKIEDFFSPKIEKENKLNEVEKNVPAVFDKIIENAAKVIETNPKNGIEPAKITEQINPHLLELAVLVGEKDEKEILKMRLHPAELGMVEITLERDSSGVLNANFKTETAEAQQALSNGLEQLRDNLQNSGWEIGRLEITNNSNSTTDNQPRQQNQPKAEWLENFIFNHSSAQPDETEKNSPQRLLNLLA
jgi:hypothetical protein